MYHAGVDIETISKFLGHESTIETLKYLGINLDDMDAGMKCLDEYDQKMGSEALESTFGCYLFCLGS